MKPCMFLSPSFTVDVISYKETVKGTGFCSGKIMNNWKRQSVDKSKMCDM